MAQDLWQSMTRHDEDRLMHAILTPEIVQDSCAVCFNLHWYSPHALSLILYKQLPYMIAQCFSLMIHLADLVVYITIVPKLSLESDPLQQCIPPGTDNEEQEEEEHQEDEQDEQQVEQQEVQHGGREGQAGQERPRRTRSTRIRVCLHNTALFLNIITF